MIKVEKTAKTLDEGIKNMMAVPKKTTGGLLLMDKKELSGYSKEQVENWDNKTKIKEGQKYIKIVQDTGVFCFIAKNRF